MPVKTVFSEAIIKEDSSSVRKKYSKRTLSYFNIPRKGVAHIGTEYRHQSCNWYGLACFLTYPAGEGGYFSFPSLHITGAILPVRRGSRGEQCVYISAYTLL